MDNNKLRKIYLNHASVSPIPLDSANAMKKALDSLVAQGPDFDNWIRSMEACRKNVAQLMGASAQSIAFLQNTSQAISTIALGIDWQPEDEIIIPSVEYPANAYPWMSLKRLGVKVVMVDPNRNGIIDINSIKNAITNKTRLVSVSHVQYSNGFRMDIKELSQICHAKNILVSVDVIQSLGALPVDVVDWDVDFAGAGSQKWLLGPPGIGILYIKNISGFRPAMVGAMSVNDPFDFGNLNYELAPDFHRFESGTANFIGFTGLEVSTDKILSYGIENISKKVLDLNEYCRTELTNLGFEIISPRGREISSGICVFKHKNIDSTKIVAFLEQNDIISAVRNKCIRFSPHYYNSKEEIQHCVKILNKFI